MLNQFSRTELIYGKEAMEKLQKSRVAIFGIGGVGGYTAEALARSGVGTLDLIDDDKVCLTNINRQIYATRKTVGRYKVDVAAERIAEINPDAVVNKHQVFYTPDTADQFDFSQYDYIVDAIDTVTGKLALVENANRTKTPIISSMGAGNKVDPTAFEVTDIFKTSVCPLAKVMRTELKKRKIKKVKVLFYTEISPGEKRKRLGIKEETVELEEKRAATGRPVPGSVSFVPGAAGLMIAGQVVRDLVNL